MLAMTSVIVENLFLFAF